jgi:acyl carrier protein
MLSCKNEAQAARGMAGAEPIFPNINIQETHRPQGDPMSDKQATDPAAIRERIVGFITSNFLFGDKGRLPPDAESLLETGIIDSTGVLELIEFLEEAFSIEVLERETVPENLGSVANLQNYVVKKKS